MIQARQSATASAARPIAAPAPSFVPWSDTAINLGPLVAMEQQTPGHMVVVEKLPKPPPVRKAKASLPRTDASDAGSSNTATTKKTFKRQAKA